MVEAPTLMITDEARAWLLQRESCAAMLHNLDCAPSTAMWLASRARPGTVCPRWERCTWHTTTHMYEWSGVVPAGPPTPHFLDCVLVGIRTTAPSSLPGSPS